MKPYTESKEGPRWMGNVPKHWQVQKAKYVFREVSRKGFENEALLSVTQKHGVIRRDSMAEFDMRGMHVSTDLTSFKLVVPGDFVISLRSFEGGIELSRVRGVVSPAYTVMQPRIEICDNYWHMLLKCHSFIEELNSIVTGIRQGKNIAYSDFSELILAFPPLEEQKQIVAYLATKNREIESYIAAKRALLIKLKELSAAVISRAVTQGLNPEVKTKPSGVDWLGDVPEHWEVKRLKFVVNFASGGTPSKDNAAFWNGDIPWVSPKDMKSFYIEDTQDHITKAALESSVCFKIEPQCLLMVVRSGILKHSIPCAINLREVTVNQDIKVLKPKRKDQISSLYLSYLFNGCQKSLLPLICKVGTTVESVEHDFLANLKIPVPPLQEQKAIAAHIETQLAVVRDAQTRIEREIELARELWTTLVAEVVTGQVDVRDAVFEAVPDEPLFIRDDLTEGSDEYAEEEATLTSTDL